MHVARILRTTTAAATAALLLTTAVVTAPPARADTPINVTYTDVDGVEVTQGIVFARQGDQEVDSGFFSPSPFQLVLPGDGTWVVSGIDFDGAVESGPTTVDVVDGVADPAQLTITNQQVDAPPTDELDPPGDPDNAPTPDPTPDPDPTPTPDPTPDPGPAPGPAPTPDPTPEPTDDPTPGPDAPAPSLGDACDDLDAPTFDDVDPAGPFAPMIACLAGYGLVTGDGTGAFRPTADVTRGEAARFVDGFVTAATGRALPTPDGNPFTDVATDGPLAVHVLRLHAAGIVTGRTTTTYDPAATLTRGEMAGIVHDALAAVGVELPAPATTFNDTPDGGVFTERIATLASAGIVDGYADGTYRPGSDITRGALAKFIALGIAEADTATPDRFAANDG